MMIAVTAGAVVTACGGGTAGQAVPQSPAPQQQSSSAPTGQPGSTAPASTGVQPGIIVASCSTSTLGADMTIAAYQPGNPSPTSQSLFPWAPLSTNEYDSASSCLDVTALNGQHLNRGATLRSGFDKDYTHMLVSHADPANDSRDVGWLDSATYAPITPKVEGDFTKQDNGDPLYSANLDRVYYWDRANEPEKLMSCKPDGSDAKAETALGKTSAADVTDNLAYVVDTTGPAPIFSDRNSSTIYPRSGTLAANVVIEDLIIVPAAKAGELRTATAGIPLKLAGGEEFSESLSLDAFVDDHTVVFHDSKQIYLAKVSGKSATVTTVLHNNKLAVWDVVPAPDGQTLAFMTGDGQSSSLYTIPVSGGEPAKVTTFDGTASVIEYTGA